MTSEGVWLALAAAGIVGFVLGALAALLWRTRREHALRLELATLQAQVKAEEIAAGEREQALERTREQLRAVFGELAHDSLKSNSEVFLQLARERLTREQQDASPH